MLRKYSLAGLLLVLLIPGCKKNDPVKSVPANLQLSSVRVGPDNVQLTGAISTGLPVDQPIVLSFSSALDIATTQTAITIKNASQPVEVDFSYLDNNKTVSIKPKQALENSTQYTLSISDQLRGASQEGFPGLQVDFKTIAAALSVVSYSIGSQAITTTTRILMFPWTFPSKSIFPFRSIRRPSAPAPSSLQGLATRH